MRANAGQARQQCLWDFNAPKAKANVDKVDSPQPPFRGTVDGGTMDEELAEELEECRWSEAVANDPRHRPQVLHAPSTTVRREWRRFPQEAHLLDEGNNRYRRLSVEEMAVIQGFPPGWFDVPGLRPVDRIRAIGDAVPPPLAKAVLTGIGGAASLSGRAVEICAGAGGLASAASACGLAHELLVDQWSASCKLLSHGKPWEPERVLCKSVREVDFSGLRGRVCLLSGGPPCQPWSQAGRHAGLDDPRDLLGFVHNVVEAIEPLVFVFENVPGLITPENQAYLEKVLTRLRSPREGLKYGATAGVLNAANYGVPQRRRRLFLIGIRDASTSTAFRVFDRIYAAATHRDPIKPDPDRRPWVTLGEAFDGMKDPGGWRRWIG